MTVIVAAVLLLVLWLAGSPSGDKRISIYSSVANYSLPVIEREGHDYVALLELLEPLGQVSTRAEGRRWKVRYNDVDSEFTAGKARVRIRGRDLDLPGNFLLEQGRGLVPLSCLSTLLPGYLGGPVNFHETARRLFVGEVSVHFTAQVSRTTPPSLVMDFTSPVNPTIATEPGILRMVFRNEPLVAPGSPTLTFGNPTIPSASYEESNGTAAITISGSVPLLASFSNDGRTITVAPAPQAVSQAPAGAGGTQPGGTAFSPPQPGIVSPGSNINAAVPYFAVVDASHGGDERGAALSDQLAEKDVTLSLARSLKQELEARGLSTLLLRDGDSSLTLDQRAALVNRTHPQIYVCIHATSQGTGVRLYTALLPAGGENRGSFFDWDTAQSSFRPLSQTAAVSVAAELQKQQVATRALMAPLRPLNNLATAAVAIEVAPPATGIPGLTSPEYQQLIASSIAAGVAAVRDKLEAAR